MLRLSKGGHLKYVIEGDEQDVTSQSTRYLFEIIGIDEGVTLRDLFLMIHNSENKNIYSEILYRNYFDSFYSNFLERFNEQGKPLSHEIKYLDVSNQGAEWGSTLEFSDILEVDGKDSTGQAIGVDFVDLVDLLPLELTLSSGTFKDSKNRDIIINRSLFTLLSSVFYELSFYGSPEDKKRTKIELDEMVSDIEEDSTLLTAKDFEILLK